MGTSRWQSRKRHALVAPWRGASLALFPARKLPYGTVDPCERSRAGADVQIVNVLREHLAAGPERPFRDDVMGPVWPTGEKHLTSPRVPFPHQKRIARKRLRRREILGAMMAPQSGRSPERRDAARR